MGVKKLWSEGAGSPLFKHYRYTNKHWASAGEIVFLHGHGAGEGSPLLNHYRGFMDKISELLYPENRLCAL